MSDIIPFPQPPPPPPPCSLGAAEMEQLRKEFSGTEFREVVEMFKAEAQLKLPQMEAALDRQDNRALRRAAHALRGAAANFGADLLVTLCQGIELTSRASDFDTASRLLEQVREEFRQVEFALEKECNEPSI